MRPTTLKLIHAFVLNIIVSSAFAADPENSTTVYKIVAPDGSISFSDQPQEKAELIHVKPIETIPALALPTSTSQASPQTSNEPVTKTALYQKFSFLQPSNDSAIHSGSGEIDVIIELQPGLRRGDQIQLFLDKQLISSGVETRHTLTSVDRGTHQLSAKIISQQGQVVQQTQSNFTVHRPSVKK